MKGIPKSLCLTLTVLLLYAPTALMACTCINDFQRIKTLEDLKTYEFVALVKVTSETVNPPSGTTSFPDARLGFKIIEKFKGKDIVEMIEQDVESSCDMGIEVGEEWVLFATAYNGKVLISACNRNVRYRDKDGVRDWHYKRGMEEVEDLRTLYGSTPYGSTRYGSTRKQQRDGLDQQYYPDGKIEVEQPYHDGLRNGIRTVYHRNGKVWGKQLFVNDSLQGKSEWFYPSGQLYDQKFYRKGILINMSRVYYDTTIIDRWKQLLIKDFYETEDSLRKTHSRIQVWMEALYDYDGKIVLSREYSRWGKIQNERVYHPEETNYRSIYYHDNGQVKVVQHHKDYNNNGHYQEYDSEGNPAKSWDYDASGRQINLNIPNRPGTPRTDIKK